MQTALVNRPIVLLERIFVRKMHWHTERSAVLSPALEQPKLNVQLDVRHSPLPGQPLRMKLELVLSALCESAGRQAFEARIHLAGIFKLEDPRQAADQQVIDFCAAQVYPHLRRLFANQTLAGGFQGLLLHDRHLETALYRLFMGGDSPQGGFAEVFGTLPAGKDTAAVSTPIPPKKRSGTPTILRFLSRRALRSRWLYLALSVPIWSGLFIGIGWWLAERDHLQTMFGPGITAMIKPGQEAPERLNKANEGTVALAPAPSSNVVNSVDDTNHSASAQILRLEKDGRDWLSAQPDNSFTVILAKSPSARSLVNQIDELTINSPVFLVGLNGGRYAAITGAFSNATEAQRESTRLAKRWPALKPEILPIAKVRSAQ